MERCTTSRLDNWEKMKFGPNYEHLKCPDRRFERYVEENRQLAEQYISSGKLFAFEVCMVTPSERQLIGFRVTLSQFDYPECRRIRNVYSRFSTILERVRTIGISQELNAMMHSCKYRPRIRMLTRLRPDSKRKIDRSKAEESTIAVPLSDSFPLISNLLTFYAFM